ncbi:TetR/AcrR family transcriptional regulator [Glaciecola petra]|uniref:TetR/AcrR family transcriptional regulator n=1 Tax=Glaciecola petra TaxID=3075602 RepID=A0ABU2ZSG1_9ALTE|nr:TetR/AcrR family transcriptional regulator [Aestuariibacter sp. P117]MDT0595573.1 TetR/AcrR family transcriptional regulator [Aestuariibacter sp. P117]
MNTVNAKMQANRKIKGAGRPKSKEKRDSILHAAAELLLAHGYAGTSMEAVAKESGVSKQTVYSHFTNKDALYNAIIENKCDEYQIEISSFDIQTHSLEDILTLIGVRFVQLLTDENVISMYKLVIGESKQDTHVGSLFHEAGPVHSVNIVADLLTKHPSSALPFDKARELSGDFFNLLKGDFHMRSILHLPYDLDTQATQLHAEKVAKKTVGLIPFL